MTPIEEVRSALSLFLHNKTLALFRFWCAANNVPHYVVTEAEAYFDPANLNYMLRGELQRQELLQRLDPNNRERGTITNTELSIDSRIGSILVPTSTFNSTDKGRITTLLWEYNYPELANHFYRFLADYGLGTIVEQGRPEAIIDLIGDNAVAQFKTYGQQWRSVAKCEKACVVTTRGGLDLTNKMPDVNDCLLESVKYHIDRDTGSDVGIHDVQFLRMDAQNIKLLLASGHEILSIYDDNFTLQAIVEYANYDDEIYWHNTYMRRNDTTRKLGIGNYAIYQLLETAHWYKKPLNLGLAVYDYKQVYKPRIKYAPSISL